MTFSKVLLTFSILLGFSLADAAGPVDARVVDYLDFDHRTVDFVFTDHETDRLFQRALGQMQSGNFNEARVLLVRTQLKIHSTHGVLSPYQLPVLDWLIRCEGELGNVERMELLQHLHHRIIETTFGPESAEYLYSIYRVANWHWRRRDYATAYFEIEVAREVLGNLQHFHVLTGSEALGIKAIGNDPGRLRKKLDLRAQLLSTLMLSS